MPDPRVEQKLVVTASQPGTAWNNDAILPIPYQVLPADGATLCPPGSGSLVGIRLSWLPSVGATSYLLQWCLNSSYQGPSIRSMLVVGTYYDLVGMTDIRQKEEIHWRVCALNGAGGASEFSESRTVKFECPQDQQPGDGSGKSGNPAGTRDIKCSDYNVVMKLTGPRIVMCCDKIAFKLQTTWDCKDQFRRSLIEPASVAWSMRQGEGGCVIASSNFGSCIIKTNCQKDQLVHLDVDFTWNVTGGGSFTCRATTKFFVDCTTGTPPRKPWLYIRLPFRGRGVQSYIAPSYWGNTLFPDNPYYRSMSSVANLDKVLVPGTAGTASEEDGGEPLGTLTVANAIAAGPVIKTGDIDLPSHSPLALDCGEIQPSLGSPTGHVLEARVHLAFGCGLKVESHVIRVNNEHLAGNEGSRKGLKTYGPCSLQVDTGCGLVIEDQKVAIDTSNLTPTNYFWSVDPDSVTFSLSSTYLTLSMGFQEKYFLKNDCGVLIGDVQDGSSIVKSFYIDIYSCGTY